MSATTVTVEIVIDGIARAGLAVLLNDATGTYGVKRNDTGAVVVAAGTAMTDAGGGLYAYTFTDPASDLAYTAAVEYVYDGETYRQEAIIAGASAATLTLDTAKKWLRVEHSDDDTLIGDLIVAAETWWENITGRDFETDRPDALLLVGIKWLVGHMYENREATTPLRVEELPRAVMDIVTMYRPVADLATADDEDDET